MSDNKIKPVWTLAKKGKLCDALIEAGAESAETRLFYVERSTATAIFNGLGIPSEVYSDWEKSTCQAMIRNPDALIRALNSQGFTEADITAIKDRLKIGLKDAEASESLQSAIAEKLHAVEPSIIEGGTTPDPLEGDPQSDPQPGKEPKEGEGNGVTPPPDIFPAFHAPGGFLEKEQSWGTFFQVVSELAQQGDKAILETVSEAIENVKKEINPNAVTHDQLKEKLDEILQLVEISKGFEFTIDTKKFEVPKGTRHKLFQLVLKYVAAGVNVLLVGPAGSGKTTCCQQVFEVLDQDFHFQGAADSPYKLLGYRDAQGHYQDTPFRRAFENGGGFLLDEFDASNPTAVVTAINTALTHDIADFPDGPVNRHKDFYFMAAANTFGRGADRQYVGRYQQDAANLDRFAVIEFDYDEALELAVAGNADWTKKVQKIRKVVWKQGIRHVVSPRASIHGAKLLAAGVDEKLVMDSVIWRGLDVDAKKKIQANL